MKLRPTLFVGLAIGLLALGGLKAFSYFRGAPARSATAEQWVCPMRCLNRLHDAPGDCPVCHMKLKPYRPAVRRLLGYSCPLHRSERIFEKGGPCPFCGLTLKEHYDGPPPPLPAHSGRQQWAALNGKTAVYYRPYEVRAIGVERIVRGAGPLQDRDLRLRLTRDQRQGLKPGLSAMVMPPQGFARPVLATLTALGPGDQARLRLARPIPGSDWATAEIRVESRPQLAVPLPALLEADGTSTVFVMQGEFFEPRTVTVQSRAESYAVVQGLQAGETIAGAGVFWLDAEWRMEHP